MIKNFNKGGYAPLEIIAALRGSWLWEFKSRFKFQPQGFYKHWLFYAGLYCSRMTDQNWFNKVHKPIYLPA